MPSLTSLDTLLSSVTWRERFVALCVRDHPLRDLVEHWAEDQLKGLRWQVVSRFCVAATCPVFCFCFGLVTGVTFWLINCMYVLSKCHQVYVFFFFSELTLSPAQDQFSGIAIARLVAIMLEFGALHVI